MGSLGLLLSSKSVGSAECAGPQIKRVSRVAFSRMHCFAGAASSEEQQQTERRPYGPSLGEKMEKTMLCLCLRAGICKTCKNKVVLLLHEGEGRRAAASLIGLR